MRSTFQRLLIIALAFIVPPSRSIESRLCPDSPDRNSGGSSSFRFHRETRRCYEAGEKGPCPPLMRFYAEDSTFGNCDCDHTLRCGRPLLYWKPDRRCYPAHDQGPCRDGKWLVFGFDLQPVCKKNPCIVQENKDPSLGIKYWVNSNQTCYKTGSRGPCVDPEEKLYNMDLHFRPTCQKQTNCGPYERMRNMPCFPGQKMDVEGRCLRRMVPPVQQAEAAQRKPGPRIPPTPPPANVYCLFCKGRTQIKHKLRQS